MLCGADIDTGAGKAFQWRDAVAARLLDSLTADAELLNARILGARSIRHGTACALCGMDIVRMRCQCVACTPAYHVCHNCVVTRGLAESLNASLLTSNTFQGVTLGCLLWPWYNR